ncbi:MAG: PilW family protein [Steroidobacteraceae bacterium]
MNARGFSLIELLIASALGALLVVGAIGAYAHGRQLYDRSERIARLHETASYVFSALEPDLQLAGYYGFYTASENISVPVVLPASLLACGSLSLEIALQGSDQRYSLPCPANGGGAMDESDTVTVRRAAVESAVPEHGRAQIFTSRHSPALQSLRLDGVLRTQLQAGEVELRNLVVRTYYVARRSDGNATTPALRVKSLGTIAGRPAFIDTEVMSGVEDLQVEFGYVPDSRRSAAPMYVSPGLLPADAYLVAARLWLRLRSEEFDAGYRDQRRYRYANQSFNAADHHQRVLVSRTVQLRNARP